LDATGDPREALQPGTGPAHISWIRRLIVFPRQAPSTELWERQVTAFVSGRAARAVSASTQNQALSAILFLFEVAHRPDRMKHDGGACFTGAQ
jgi:hypothetical protein